MEPACNVTKVHHMIAAISLAETHSETASTEPTHWMKGRYFVPMPELSDETSWVISQGRAWPTFMAILRILHQQERKGATEEIRHDAIEGRLGSVGVNGLASITGMTSTAVLRQLRYLERQGLIRTHQERCTVELDPATGKIRKNFAKAPPKVIIVTIKDHHLRPTRAASAPQRDTPGTNPSRSGDTPGSNPSRQNPRVRNDCVPKDSNLQRDWSPLDSNGRTAAAGRKPAAAAAKGAAKPAAPPAREQEWQRNHREAKRKNLVDSFAKRLGMNTNEIEDLWKSDAAGLWKRLIDAGVDPNTGRPSVTLRDPYATAPRRDPYASLKEPLGISTPPESPTFDLRAKTVQAVSLNTEPAEAATAGVEAFDQEEARQAALAMISREQAKERATYDAEWQAAAAKAKEYQARQATVA